MGFTIDLEAALHFSSIDGYLQQQRQVVASLRAFYDADAARIWNALSPVQRARFAGALGRDVALPEREWNRAWWLHAIGGTPRAPFVTGLSPEDGAVLFAALSAALDPAVPPSDRRAAFEAWWAALIERCRALIARYVDERIQGARRRLLDEGVLEADVATGTQSPGAIRHARRSRRGVGDRQRIRASEQACLDLHRALDLRFRPLQPVCGACVRQTGGCCTITVPLIWRENDFRLLAFDTPAPMVPDPALAGACPFLGASGCRLPSERRPHICRSFLCESAEAALGTTLEGTRGQIERLTRARSQLA